MINNDWNDYVDQGPIKNHVKLQITQENVSWTNIHWKVDKAFLGSIHKSNDLMISSLGKKYICNITPY